MSNVYRLHAEGDCWPDTCPICAQECPVCGHEGLPCECPTLPLDDEEDA